MKMTNKQIKEITDFGKVSVSHTIRSYGDEYHGYINGKEIVGQSMRFYQALEYVEIAQARIRKEMPVSIEYYNEFLFVKEHLQ